VPLQIKLARLGYRAAYRVLQAWWFLRRPEAHGVKCVLTQGERVLLVRHTYGRPNWDLPGGAVKRRELPLEAARREMSEELGVGELDWTALGEYRARENRRRDVLHCFRASLESGELDVDPVEIEATSWFARNGLPPNVSPNVAPVLALLGSS
jgi:8-oxo-dGTP pyrophosphatase MutT (NUDIX family)